MPPPAPTLIAVDIGTPLGKMGATDVHGWLLHAVPEQFGPRDPLAKHVAPAVRALLAFTERTDGRELPAVRAARLSPIVAMRQ